MMGLSISPATKASNWALSGEKLRFLRSSTTEAHLPRPAGMASAAFHLISSITAERFPCKPGRLRSERQALGRKARIKNNAAAKTLTSKGATLWATKDLDVTAGMIGGDGTIKSPNINLMGVVKDAAKMQGGDAPGTLSVVGNINFLSNSALFVDLGGTIQGSPTNGYSFVTDDGNVLLAGGDLDLEFIDGFQSLVTSANVFDILTSDNPIDGTFLDAPVNGDRVTTIDGSGSFQVYYLGDTVELRNFEATVSEPSTMALFASGLIMLGWRLKPKKHKPSRNVLGRIMQRHRRSSLHRNAAQAHVNDAGAVWNAYPALAVAGNTVWQGENPGVEWRNRSRSRSCL